MVRQVVLVEDQDEEVQRIQSFFERYNSISDDTFQITRYKTADAFIACYQPVFDIVLMDIMLPGTNGMDAAQELRKLDKNVTLIFVTNMAQFAVRGYEVEAFDFIVKPVSYQNFVVKMDRVLRKLKNEQRDTRILLNLPEGKKRIAPSQIRYVEVNGHRLIYHTTEGNYAVYGSMKAVEEQLSDQVFSRCNHCYLVNLNFVTAVGAISVMLGKEELQLSRSRKKGFIEQLNTFLGGNI